MRIVRRIARQYLRRAANYMHPDWKWILPEDMRNQEPERPEGTNLVIWRGTFSGKPFAAVFAGRSKKPVRHNTYLSESHREQDLSTLIESSKSSQANKRKRREDMRSGPLTVKPGDIFVDSWGYNQTNVDFYEVIEIRGKMTAVLRMVGKKTVSSGRGSEKVIPTPGKYIDSPIRKRIQKRGESYSFKVNSFSYASLWNGKPVYQTASGWGH